MVGARLHALHREFSLVVGAGNALKAAVGECGVGEIAVEPHHHVLHGFEVAPTEHHTRHAHRVDSFACGKRKAVAVEPIALVVVFYGVAKIDGVGGVGE